jgi:hypothetical protein
MPSRRAIQHWPPKSGTYRGMSETPFLINAGEGAALPFCEIGCFNTYSYYRDVEGVNMGKKLKSAKNICFHCAACGRKLFNIKSCVLHDNDCPDWLWYAAYPIMTDFLDGIEEMTGESDISAIMWDTADQIAAANTFISGTDLAILTSNILGLSADED